MITTLEEFCKEGSIEEYTPIMSNDDGDMRIDVDFELEEDDRDYKISFIANIFEICYDDLLDDGFDLEEFDGPIYFINAGSFVWSSSNWKELLDDYYFDFDSVMDAVKSKLELFINELLNEDEPLEYCGIHISNYTSQDKANTESILDSFVESLI